MANTRIKKIRSSVIIALQDILTAQQSTQQHVQTATKANTRMKRVKRHVMFVVKANTKMWRACTAAGIVTQDSTKTWTHECQISANTAKSVQKDLHNLQVGKAIVIMSVIVVLSVASGLWTAYEKEPVRHRTKTAAQGFTARQPRLSLNL